jgi:DNA polymerase III delta subunit
MIVLVHGPDAVRAGDEVARLLRKHDPDGFNTSTLDGREVTIPSLISAIGSVGFFGTTRVVVVRDLMSRATRSTGQSGATESSDASPALNLAPLFEAVPEQNLLILTDPALSAIPAAVKKVMPVGTTVFAAAVPRGRPLVDWVVSTAQASGGDFDRRAAEAMLQALYPQTWAKAPTNPRYDRPPDTEQLRQEIERLVLYAYPDQVTSAHVRELVEQGPNDRVFRFIDAVVAGQLDVATAELERLLLAGEEPAKLVAQLQQQVELAAVVAAAGSRQPGDVGKEIGLSNPARMTGVAASIRGRSPAATLAAVARATAIDRGLKTGHLRQPTDALYQLIVELGRRSRPTEQGGA